MTQVAAPHEAGAASIPAWLQSTALRALTRQDRLDHTALTKPGEPFTVWGCQQDDTAMLTTDHVASWLAILHKHKLVTMKWEFNKSTHLQEVNNGVWLLNTYFYSKLMDNGAAGMERWERGLNLSQTHTIIIPVHHPAGPGHWTVMVVRLKHNTIVHYDSI